MSGLADRGRESGNANGNDPDSGLRANCGGYPYSSAAPTENLLSVIPEHYGEPNGLDARSSVGPATLALSSADVSVN
jgi:hypothetical protein